MAYTGRNTWVAPIGTDLNVFTDQRTGNQLELTSNANYTNTPTPINADWLNNLEEGVETNTNTLSNLDATSISVSTETENLYGVNNVDSVLQLIRVPAERTLPISLFENGTIHTTLAKDFIRNSNGNTILSGNSLFFSSQFNSNFASIALATMLLPLDPREYPNNAKIVFDGVTTTRVIGQFGEPTITFSFSPSTLTEQTLFTSPGPPTDLVTSSTNFTGIVSNMSYELSINPKDVTYPLFLTFKISSTSSSASFGLTINRIRIMEG